jgi:hypothetical protein
MIEKLKKIVALYLLKKKYLKRIDNNTNKKNFFRNSDSFLIILPENDEDYNNSLDIAKYLAIHKKNVSLLLPDYKYSLVDRNLNYNLITYGLNSKTRMNLPAKSLTGRLENKKYDVIMDLNRKEDVFFTGVSLVPQTNIRIGVNKDKTNSFYNVRFNISENNSEISYRNLLNSLSMF